MIELRIIFGAVAVLLSVWVAWGYRDIIRISRDLKFRLVWWRDLDDEEAMAVAGLLLRISVVLSHFLNTSRISYWDVIRPVLGEIGIMSPIAVTLNGMVANLAFSSLSIFISLMVLLGLWVSLPKVDRGRYTIISAPLYPYRFTLRRLTK